MKKKSFGFILSLLCLVPAVLHAQVEEEWLFYQSDARITGSRMPAGYKVQTSEFVIGSDKTLRYEEIIGSFDKRPDENEVKTYSLRVEQTLGQPLSKEELQFFLTQDIKDFKTSYEAKAGQTILENIGKLGPYLFGESIIEYNDDQFGKQSVRNRTILTPSTKFTLQAIGAPDVMTSLRTRDFFDKIEFRDLIDDQERDITKFWQSIEAPYNTYTIFVPKQSDVYFKNKPKTQKTNNSAFMSLVFEDPVRKQKLFYNIYTYYFNRNMTFQDAEKLIKVKHINNRRKQRSNPVYKQDVIENVAFMRTALNIDPLKNHPYANAERLKIQFFKTHVVVQELISSTYLIQSDFANQLLANIDFHPETSELGKQSRNE